MSGTSLHRYSSNSSSDIPLTSNLSTNTPSIHRSIYNPLLSDVTNLSAQLSTSTVHSVYPNYNPTEYELAPVSLTVPEPLPELPPRPTAYQPQNKENQVRLIYTKSGFYLKSSEEELIHGFFAIFSKSMENVNIFVAWIPEYLIQSHDIPKFIELDGILASDQNFPAVELSLGQQETTVIALKNIYSLYLCPPTTEKQGHVAITSNSGDVLKPLWYAADHQHNFELDKQTWPGFTIADVLGAFHPLQNSRNIPYLYRVQDLDESPIPSPTLSTASLTPAAMHSTLNREQPDEPIMDTLKEARWSLLERLSKVTQYSRQTATQALGNSLISPFLPAFFRESATVQDTVSEYEVASNYLSQWGSHNRDSQEHFLEDDTDGLLQGMPELAGPTPIHTRTPPVSPEVWVTLFDHEGKLATSVDHVRQLIFSGGLEHDIRIEAWKFLLGIYPWQSTFDEREAIRRSQADAYFEIKRTWFDHPDIRNSKHFQDEKHRIDKDVHRTDRTQEAFVGEDMPNPDPVMNVGTNANLEVMKDMLVSYNYHNTDLGYVQGMSDLLAPLFVAMGDEAMAFWAFSQFMERVQSNFFQDQSGMHRQLQTLNTLLRFMDPSLHKRLEETGTDNLFFCFRWLLVWFKREFDWEDVIRLWEVLWTDYLTDQMIIFVALAVIETHRDKIMSELTEFDEVLRYINDLSGKIPLEDTLERAEVLYYQFERKVRAMQHKTTLLQEQLQVRSIWNSNERPKIQAKLDSLKIPDILLTLIPSKQ
ncbi:rab-GTPase-TBC domain-containing protein [Choanephora cucurbitarum]|nr:rab-GTPase-TBC domain-containing protein [Choanephora cucurbitarum]